MSFSFERLLFSPCLLPGQTRFKENKTIVEMENLQPNETVLFFSIDNQSNASCQLRNDLWGNRQGQKMCDLIVFYAKGNDKTSKDYRRVFCFVELKDNRKDFLKAIDQLINTYQTIKLDLKLTNHYDIQAFIIGHHGAAPSEHSKAQEKLKACFGDGKYRVNANVGDFSNFLRKISNSPTQSRKDRRKQKQQNN